MSARIRHHIRSNVIGYLALFVALSGTAYAVDGPLPGQDQVGSADIINNEVQSADIKDANLTTADIRSGAVTSGKVLDDTAEGGLAAVDLAAGSVGSSELQTNAIPANGFGDDGSTKLGDNSVNFNELAPDAIEGSKVEDESLSGTDIDESSLGTVPTSDKVDGADVCNAGVQKAAGSAESVLCTIGPFTVKAQCFNFGPSTQSVILIATSQDNAFVRSSYGSDPDFDADGVVLQLTAAQDATADGVAALSPVDSFYAGTAGTAHIAGTVGARANNTGSSTGTCETLVSAVG